MIGKRRIIFAVGNGITRAPMAGEIMKQQIKDPEKYEILSRGLVVQFPEPLNQKAEAVMISNGINLSDYKSKQLTDEDITENTLIFVMEEPQRVKLIKNYEKAIEENTFVLTDYVGEELEIMDPYGGNLQTYGLCFETLKATIGKLVAKLEEEAIDE